MVGGKDKSDRCGGLVRQFHHVDIVASAAKPLHVGSPSEFSKIESCNKTLELPAVVNFNMVEPLGSGLYGSVVW